MDLLAHYTISHSIIGRFPCPVYTQEQTQIFDQIRVTLMSLFGVQALGHTVAADVVFKQTTKTSSCFNQLHLMLMPTLLAVTLPAKPQVMTQIICQWSGRRSPTRSSNTWTTGLTRYNRPFRWYQALIRNCLRRWNLCLWTGAGATDPYKLL